MKTRRFLKWLFASAPPVWGDADSVDLLKNRAAQGEAEAQSALGFKYVTGEGVPQDYTEALKWYRLAAAQGDADAQFNLGVMYHNGQGVPQDYVQALKCFNLAAATSTKPDLHNLAVQARDKVAADMTHAQIAEAQKLAREWKKIGRRLFLTVHRHS